MDLTNDLDQILLVVLGTLGGIVALLFLMTALDPRTDRRRPASAGRHARARVPR